MNFIRIAQFCNRDAAVFCLKRNEGDIFALVASDQLAFKLAPVVQLYRNFIGRTGNVVIG